MSGLGRIFWKEVRELLTPATIVPIIIMAVIFAMLGNAFGGLDEEMQQKAEIGLVNDDTGSIGAFAQSSLNASTVIVYNGTSLEDGRTKLLEGETGSALIYIPANFTSNLLNGHPGWISVYYLMEGTGLSASLDSGKVDGALITLSNDISYGMIVSNYTSNATLVLEPTITLATTYLNDKEVDGVAPSQLDAVLSQGQFIVPLIVMLVIIMAGSMVISSMGSEKENKTLETLLTLPVKRTWIVFGKLSGAAVVGLIVSLIYMLGLGYYYSSLAGSSEIDLEKYGLALGVEDYLLVGISLFLALLCGLSLCMILGIFTKNYKAAQSMTLPITMLALIPMFISIFSDFNSLPGPVQVLVFAIPFSAPMFAISNITLGYYALVIAGVIYCAIFAAITMLVAVWLFKRDILLTGRVKTAERKARKVAINDLFGRSLLKKR
jgi:ABC-2 type transport system permease protein